MKYEKIFLIMLTLILAIGVLLIAETYNWTPVRVPEIAYASVWNNSGEIVEGEILEWKIVDPHLALVTFKSGEIVLTPVENMTLYNLKHE